MTPRVYKVRTVDDRLREALGRLLPQLSPTLAVPSDAALRAVIAAPRTHLLAAELDGAVVGTLALVAYEALSGGKAWIEDVVVDAAARGRGVGEALLREALVVARREGIRKVQLTSALRVRPPTDFTARRVSRPATRRSSGWIRRRERRIGQGEGRSDRPTGPLLVVRRRHSAAASSSGSHSSSTGASKGSPSSGRSIARSASGSPEPKSKSSRVRKRTGRSRSSKPNFA